MGFLDALKSLDAAAMNANYGGELLTFKLKNPVGSEIEFQGSFLRDDLSTKEQTGRYVHEKDNTIIGWISGVYTYASAEHNLVPDGNLFVSIGGSWYRWNSTYEGDGSTFLCEFKRTDLATGVLSANRRN